MENKTFEKLERLVDLIDGEKVTTDEVAQVFSLVFKALAETQQKLSDCDEYNKTEVSNIVNSIRNLQNSVDDKFSKVSTDSGSKVASLKQDLYKEIESLYEVIENLPKPEKVDIRGIIDQAVFEAKQLFPKPEPVNLDEIWEEIEEIQEELKKPSKTIERVIERGNMPGASMVRVLDNGRPIGDTVQEINIIGAASISYTSGTTGRRANITVGSFSLLTPVETPNGTATQFTFTSAPSVIVVDNGRTMRATNSDGTVNWTGTTTITLTVAPIYDIFGF